MQTRFIFQSPEPPFEPLCEGEEGFKDNSGLQYPVLGGVLDLMGNTLESSQSANHYTKQWGSAIGYVDFIRSNPTAAAATMARKLDWPQLFEEIRSRARTQDILVYDAACGFGSIFSDLFAEPTPPYLYYVGCDIHNALSTIPRPNDLPLSRARFLRWDISRRIPTKTQFDYVLCRAAIHHTPSPRESFRQLTDALKPGGTIAISAYTKKTIVREAVDDALRNKISSLSPDFAFEISREFSTLGRSLHAAKVPVVIERDLSFLGIRAGTYSVHELVYDHLIKCWYNTAFGDYSDVVNFDWYHPQFAYRYDLEELCRWFVDENLEIARTSSHKAQHYVQGIKPILTQSS